MSIILTMLVVLLLVLAGLTIYRTERDYLDLTPRHTIPWLPYHRRPSIPFKVRKRKRMYRIRVRKSRRDNRGTYRG